MAKAPSASDIAKRVREEPKKEGIDPTLAEAIIQGGSIALGGLFGGAGGAAVGAKAGAKGLAFRRKEQEKQEKRELEEARFGFDRRLKERAGERQDELLKIQQVKVGLARDAQKAQKARSGEQREKEQLTLASNIRKERNALPTTKDTQALESSFKKVESGAKQATAAGDVGMIFAVMKMFDPGSVVRESEFATAANAAGIPVRIRTAFNKAREGDQLGPEQRADFLLTAQNLLKEQRGLQRSIDNQFVQIGEKAGLSAEDVIVNFSADDLSQQQQQTVQAPGQGLPGVTSAEAADDGLDSASDQELDAELQRLGIAQQPIGGR